MKSTLKTKSIIRTIMLACGLFSAVAIYGTETYTCKVTVWNDSKSDKKDAPVVLSLSDFPLQFPAISGTVKAGNEEIPSQLDDLNNDG